MEYWSDCHIYSVQSPVLKKHTTGYGGATKGEMIAWAKREFGFSMTDDEADAVAVCKWTFDQYMNELNLG